MLDTIITSAELRRRIPYSPQHILRLEKAGKFPRRLKVGPARVGWLASEIRAWIENKSLNRHVPVT